MNVKHEEQKNLKDNFSQAQFRVKELITHEKKKKEKQGEKVIAFFKESTRRDLFEKDATVMRDQDKHIGPSVDFSYYKLNLEFLKNSGICLEQINNGIIASNSGMRIVYNEYYLDKKNACIILVKYHFKHVRIYSDNGKTDVMTYTFVNTRSEIHYYDAASGNVLIKTCRVNMNVSNARDLLKDKEFEIDHSDERTYEILSESGFEKKTLADIHLLPQKLLDILLEQYKNGSSTSSSQIQIETKFIGMSEPTTVQNNIKVNYKCDGVIQTTENLLEYEISLYFKEFPEKKVIARFYLTETEKERKLVLTEELLEKITLENVREKLERDSNYCKHFYKEFLIDKAGSGKKNPELRKIAEIFYRNMRIEDTFVEFPKLKDIYKGIYVEYFEIKNAGIYRNFPFAEQIRESKLEYDGKNLKQSTMYAVLYDDQLYLIELYATYLSYTYVGDSIVLRFPAFAIEEVEAKIFKPVNPKEIDSFVCNSENEEIAKRSTEFRSSNNRDKIQRKSPYNKKDWKKIFPDFVIQTDGKRETYQVVKCNSDAIYEKIFECITALRNETSRFSFSTNYPFGYDDDDVEKVKIPFISSGIEYGHYFDDGFNQLSVNSPFKEKCDYSYSSADDLFGIVFDGDIPYFKTTFHSLMYKYENTFHRGIEIRNTLYQSIGRYAFWDECIKFLLHIQKEKFFK